MTTELTAELTDFSELVGKPFRTKGELKEAGLHGKPSEGISWWSSTGIADAIALNGGYEDDEDHGDWLIYTGHGGNEGGKQVRDQEFHKGNRALWEAWTMGRPIRIIRGYKLDSEWAPKSGFRYDGLYCITDAWRKRGKSNYQVFLFRLEGIPGCFKIPGYVQDRSGINSGTDSGKPAERRFVTGSRIIRNTKLTRRIKEIYKCQCQICDTTLDLPAGPYAEGAHIHQLGSPHDGPDSLSNLLCLCPSCHVKLDYGAIWIDDDLNVQPSGVQLTTFDEHEVDIRCIRYHRKLFKS